MQQWGAPIRSWFFRIAANLIADLYRAPVTVQPLQVRQSGQTLSAIGVAREDQAWHVWWGTGLRSARSRRRGAAIAAWEDAEDFLRLLVDLTPEQRTVLHLRFADGLPIAEIAARMARSQGSVKMLMMRGLQHLRRRWETADE